MLTEEVEKYDQQIHFYAYNLNMNLSSFKSAHISLAAYLRLFVADILLQRYIRYYIWTAISS